MKKRIYNFLKKYGKKGNIKTFGDEYEAMIIMKTNFSKNNFKNYHFSGKIGANKEKAYSSCINILPDHGDALVFCDNEYFINFAREVHINNECICIEYDLSLKEE